jgi:hypothetical protein
MELIKDFKVDEFFVAIANELGIPLREKIFNNQFFLKGSNKKFSFLVTVSTVEGYLNGVDLFLVNQPGEKFYDLNLVSLINSWIKSEKGKSKIRLKMIDDEIINDFFKVEKGLLIKQYSWNCM